MAGLAFKHDKIHSRVKQERAQPPAGVPSLGPTDHKPRRANPASQYYFAPSALAAFRTSSGFTQNNPPYRPAPAQIVCMEVRLIPTAESLRATSAAAPKWSSPCTRNPVFLGPSVNPAARAAFFRAALSSAMKLSCALRAPCGKPEKAIRFTPADSEKSSPLSARLDATAWPKACR